MSDVTQNSSGVLALLARDFTEHRMPVLMALKEKVDDGGVLEQYECEYLGRMLEDTCRAMPLTANKPDWQKLAAQVAQFFHLITEKALENEEKRRS